MSGARLPVLGFALLLAACGNDEPLPASSPGVDAGAESASVDAEPPEAGPKLRSVERRNPFGNTAAENNLMVDGDFEWTSASGQYGWRAFDSSQEVSLARETGGLCRSGVTCGILESGVALLGMAAAPRNKPMLITLYAKPPEPDCGMTRISVLSCTRVSFSSFATVPPTNAAPASNGWCQYRAIAPPLDEQPCLYVTSYAQDGQRVLIDDASIVAADGTGASPLWASAPSAELFARAVRDVRWVHEHQQLGAWRPAAP
jgi:hypothetical protein